MKTASHTPTPWATDILVAADILSREGANSGRKNDHRIDCASIYVDHGSGKGSEICTFRHDPDDGLSLLDPEQQANAAFIVRACNSHDALVSALEAVYAEYMALKPDVNSDSFRLIQKLMSESDSLANS